MRTLPNEPKDMTDAWRRLGLAILEQAVDDINHLKRAGMIKDGQQMPWPKRHVGQNPFRVANDYDKSYKVAELIEWVHSKECEGLIDHLDIPATQNDLINLLRRPGCPERHNTLRRAV